MGTLVILRLFFILTFVATQVAGVLLIPGSETLATSNNCTVGSIPCGPAPSCCASGSTCNFRRGIPVCVAPQDQAISGFDHSPCADPYLFRCDVVLGISGFCCPIGTVCRALQTDNIVHCIDALGTTALALPSATTGPVPSATPVMGDDRSIIYRPSEAWKASNTDSTCSVSKTLHVTSTINASVSFNFTGPSIMVRTITSANGGVFSVWIDGFNTSSNVDTFANPGKTVLPSCYPLQFPPFAVTPPGFETHSNHTITLIYTGPSIYSKDGTAGAVEFDSFAIPDLPSHLTATSSSSLTYTHDFHLVVLFLFALFFLFIAF